MSRPAKTRARLHFSRTRHWLTAGFLVCLVLAAAIRGRILGFQRPLEMVDLPQANGAIRLEFGLRDPAPRQWTGEIAGSQGEILSVTGWRFIYPDRVAGNGWDFRTRLFTGGPTAVYREPEAAVPILPNGVTAAIHAADSASFQVKTNHGDFTFSLADLKVAGRLHFLDGDAAAVFTPPTRSLTHGAASEQDFPAAAARDGRVYVAWTTYQNEANMVYLATRTGGTWSVTPAARTWGDYYATAVATDTTGRALVVWGEYKDDRWRLVCRIYDPTHGQWGAEQYIQGAGRRQMFPRMTSDAEGAPWVTWQERVNGHFEIFAARYRGGNWQRPIQVSESAANNWHPAIAAAPDGALYVAWDSYDSGNYDVFFRRIRDGHAQPVVRVTRSDRYNAEVSIAVDPRNRLWLAWHESGANWGKDTGVVANTGTALHASRRIRLARYENGGLSETAQALDESLPGWLREMNEYPVLAIGSNGLPYLFFRHFLARIPMVEDQTRVQIGDKNQTLQPWYDTVRQQWDVYLTAFDGQRWLPARELPDSTGRCFMQTGAVLAGESLFYVWPRDGRTYEDPHERTAQLQFAEFPTSAKPAATERMQPLVASPPAVREADAAEKRDLAAARAAHWQSDRLFRGDLHRHTDISADADRDGDILDTYRYAIDAASLDFLAVTDHSGAQRLNYYHYDWWRSRQIATLFNDPGHFVTFFAYERTVTYPGGHRNIISTRRDAQPFRISDEEFSGVESYATRLFPYLKSRGDIAIPHTTASGGGTNWNGDDPAVEPAVEIFQGLRGSYDEANGPAAAKGRNHPDGFVWHAWDLGRRVGVIADSDHLSTHESYACVWAPELTRGAILAAIKARRTFGSTDNVILRFEAVTRDGVHHRMGEELAASAAPELGFEVMATAPIKRLELIRNGSILLAREFPAHATFTYRDSAPLRGVNYYHVRIVQTNNMVTWSSPIWVKMP